MGQIVAYSRNAAGNFVIEVRPLLHHKRVKTTQIAGTNGYESLSGMYAKDPEGNEVPLHADISIRYPNNYSVLAASPEKKVSTVPFR